MRCVPRPCALSPCIGSCCDGQMMWGRRKEQTFSLSADIEPSHSYIFFCVWVPAPYVPCIGLPAGALLACMVMHECRCRM